MWFLWSYVLVCLIAILPVVIWFPFYYLYDRKKEKIELLKVSFISGILSALPLIVFQYLGFDFRLDLFNGILGLITGLLAFTFFEEVLKLTITTKVLDRFPLAHDEITDGIIYAVSLALGFSFIENLYYFFSLISTGIDAWSLSIVFMFRGLGTMLAHTVFSGIFGYFYAKAFFNLKDHEILKINEFVNDEIKNLVCSVRSKTCRNKFLTGFKRLQLLFTGGTIAVVLHLIYNLSLYFELFGPFLTFLILPLIVFGFSYLLKREEIGF